MNYLLTYPYQKIFPKKSVLQIFIILFEQDCPEAVVHELVYDQNQGPLSVSVSEPIFFFFQNWNFKFFSCLPPLSGI